LLTDNGGAYISLAHAVACRALGIRHLRTRPYRPQTNGKAERFIRTMLGGWAYGALYGTSRERTGCSGKNILLEDVASTHSVFAGQLHIHSSREFAIVKERWHVAIYGVEVDGCRRHAV